MYCLESLKVLNLITSGRDSRVYIGAPLTRTGLPANLRNIAVKISSIDSISPVTLELIRHTHPNIERIYTIMSIKSRPTECFTLCQLLSKTLSQYDPSVDPPLVTLATDMISGMEYIHSHGIIHCDIKNNNLMLNSDKRLVFIDFNNARREKEIGTLPLPTIVQTRHKDLFFNPNDWSFKVDTWACGVVLYELSGTRRNDLTANILETADIPYTSQRDEYRLDNCELGPEERVNLAFEFNDTIHHLERGHDKFNKIDDKIYQMIHFFLTKQKVDKQCKSDFKDLFLK